MPVNQTAVLDELHDWRQTYTPVKLGLQTLLRQHPELAAEIYEIIDMLDRRVAQQRRKSSTRRQ